MMHFRFFRFGHSFAFAVAALIAAAGLSGCSDGSGDVAVASAPIPADTAIAPNTNTVPGNSGSDATPVRGSTNLRLMSISGGTNLPFSVGYAFKPGDIPADREITAAGPNLHGFQAIVKNRWHDGSAKFAVLSGLVDLPAKVEQTLDIGWADAAPATAREVALSDLKATNVTAAISYGSYGSVIWTGDDWSQPFLTWISGPEMSSWLYRSPIGSDQHLVAWLEVRLYRSGAVEFVPWIENGFLLRAAPGERSGVATFSVNGTTRFTGTLNLYNHTRAVLGAERVLSHWLNGDPSVTFKHNMAYLQTSGLVPAYRGITSPNSSLFDRISTTYTPLGQHDFPTAMGSPGYDPSIGPLPEWDVVYMTSDGDPRAWAAVQINGYAAGRYGFHFRDETTHRAPRFSSYPNLVLSVGSGITGIGSSSKGQYLPSPTGGSGPTFTNSHMPSIAFMAYLITGRWYFMDEMQLLSSAMFLKQTDAVRNFEQGIISSSTGANTTRGAAWTMRALTHAAVMTPDDDEPMRSEYLGGIQNNIDWYYARYVAQPNNPLGLVEPYSDYSPGDGKTDSAAWMEDFLTWSFGNIRSTQAYDATRGTKLDQLLNWKYRSIVGRLGPNQSGSWSYRNAAVYTLPYAPAELDIADWSNGTGPWYGSWADAYAAAGLSYSPGNTLLGSYIDGTGLATGYWGNLQPAIAYAVEHGAPGALDAYNRMVGAANWASAAAYFDSETPVWSVRPRDVDY